MARSTFYYYQSQIRKPDKYKEIREVIRQIFTQHKGRYGYRRITCVLCQMGYKVNHKTVCRLMKMDGIKCTVRTHKYRSYKGEIGTVAPNLLNRNFSAALPCCKWVTDITEFNINGEKLYLSPIIDLYNREVVSYSIARNSRFELVMDMIGKAFEKIPDHTNLILHSDQGWHYQMEQYQWRLKEKGIRQSMSRKGNCLDNAVVENFFGVLKSELVYLQKFESVKELEQALVEYINYYNHERIKLKLKGLSPVKFRKKTYMLAKNIFC